MYIHVMLILINKCLLDVVFSMTKALNGSPKILPSKISILPTFQSYLEKPLNACFPFFTLPFLFQLTFGSSWLVR